MTNLKQTFFFFLVSVSNGEIKNRILLSLFTIIFSILHYTKTFKEPITTDFKSGQFKRLKNCQKMYLWQIFRVMKIRFCCSKNLSLLKKKPICWIKCTWGWWAWLWICSRQSSYGWKLDSQLWSQSFQAHLCRNNSLGSLPLSFDFVIEFCMILHLLVRTPPCTRRPIPPPSRPTPSSLPPVNPILIHQLIHPLYYNVISFV